MADKLKLFVWEGVLTDYRDGIVFALAHDLSEAIALIAKQDEYAISHIDAGAVREVTEPEAFVLWGGG